MPSPIDTLWEVQHGTACKVVGELINVASVYLDDAKGSDDEKVSQGALLSAIQEALNMGPTAAGQLLYTFATLVADTGQQEIVQAWMDEQARIVGEVLGHG